MTAAKVVDASALGALLFGEPEGERIADRLTGARLFAPTLLGYELASICVKKSRAHPEAASELQRALGLFGRLGIELLGLHPGPVADLARETGLTAYDAAYLRLSLALGAELITLDRRLAAIAARYGSGAAKP